MNPKASSILDKVQKDRGRGDLKRALDQLSAGIDSYPREIQLYKEGIDLGLEAAESRRATQFFKKAWKTLPSDRKELWSTVLEKVRLYNDPVLAQSMLDAAVGERDFDGAEDALAALKDHTAIELLERTRTKQQTLRSAMGGDSTLASQMTNSAVAEAMLCLRAGRQNDAAHTLLRVLERAPEENEVFLPFLLRLEKRDRRSGSLAFVIGCSYLRAEHWAKGLDHLVQAAVLEPACADDVITRLESLETVPEVPAEEISLARARIYLVKGQHGTAAGYITKTLEKNPAKVAAVIGLLEPFVADVGDDTSLDFLFIAVALEANRTERALTQMKKVYNVKRHRTALFAWLDEKRGHSTLSADVLNYYGEVALAQEMFEKAVEAFRAVVHQAPQEAVRIRETITPHRTKPAIKDFFSELTRLEGKKEDDTSADAFEISHYESNEFRFDAKPTPQAPPTPDPPAPTEPVVRDDDISNPGDDLELGGEDRPHTEPLETGLDIERSETVFKSDPPPVADEDDDWIDRGSPGRNPDRTGRDTTTERAASWDTEGIETDSPPVIRLGTGDDAPAREEGLEIPTGDVFSTGPPESPAVESDTPPEPTTEPPEPSPDATWTTRPQVPTESDTIAEHTAPEPEIEMQSSLDPIEETPPEEPPEPEPVDEYESLKNEFEGGSLRGANALRLVELASDRNDLDAVRRFLHFEPDNVAQEIARKQYLAEYYVRCDEPLSALIILKTLHLGALGREQRRVVLLTIAYCFRMLNRFDAAQSVYLRMLGEDGDLEEAERMARANYENYLKETTGAAPVLEKVLTL